MDRVLLLSAQFGAGHRQAARAIAEAVRESGAAAEVADLEGGLLDVVSAGYLKLLGAWPGAYRRLYHTPASRRTRSLIRSALASPVRRAIERVRPTAIVATHPFPGLVAAHLRQTGLLDVPVAMAVTDFLPHPLWVAAGVDQYFVAGTDAAHRLQVLGVAPDRIRATGIPVRSAFVPRLPTGPAGVRRVLVMGGGLGLGPITEAVRALAQLPQPDLRVAAICGSNEPLRREMVDLFSHDARITVLGHTNLMPQLMAEADLLVTKPGGLACSEALASALPMLLLPPLPGQEEENAAYLTGTGAARPVPVQWIGRAASELLYEAPHRLVVMRERARVAGRPGAAGAIAEAMVSRRQPQLHVEATG